MLDILMMIGLLMALAINYASKRNLEKVQGPEDSVRRGRWEINIALYLTAGVISCFFTTGYHCLPKAPTALLETTRRG